MAGPRRRRRSGGGARSASRRLRILPQITNNRFSIFNHQCQDWVLDIEYWLLVILNGYPQPQAQRPYSTPGECTSWAWQPWGAYKETACQGCRGVTTR